MHQVNQKLFCFYAHQCELVFLCSGCLSWLCSCADLDALGIFWFYCLWTALYCLDWQVIFNNLNSSSCTAYYGRLLKVWSPLRHLSWAVGRYYFFYLSIDQSWFSWNFAASSTGSCPRSYPDGSESRAGDLLADAFLRILRFGRGIWAAARFGSSTEFCSLPGCRQYWCHGWSWGFGTMDLWLL